MLGVTPCTIESLQSSLAEVKRGEIPTVSEANVHPIELINPDENVYQISGKYFSVIF